ncbi:hypothetical protein GGX14DRAFT_637128 [Mycena pura]|uniref:Uncharacterized protein n=1 Tax=Mycena pura TaxID=153505 RepID=A0AAD6YB62_9AGAR|nr:hypothetical protein GGX14DRAFT_637128 [Mycena pura]
MSGHFLALSGDFVRTFLARFWKFLTKVHTRLSGVLVYGVYGRIGSRDLARPAVNNQIWTPKGPVDSYLAPAAEKTFFVAGYVPFGQKSSQIGQNLSAKNRPIGRSRDLALKGVIPGPAPSQGKKEAANGIDNQPVTSQKACNQSNDMDEVGGEQREERAARARDISKWNAENQKRTSALMGEMCTLADGSTGTSGYPPKKPAGMASAGRGYPWKLISAGAGLGLERTPDNNFGTRSAGPPPRSGRACGAQGPDLPNGVVRSDHCLGNPDVPVIR